MPSNRRNQSQDARLRIAYATTVVTYSIAANVTLGEIARTIGENAKWSSGIPLAIDVLLTSRDSDLASRISRTLRPNARSGAGRTSLSLAVITAAEPSMPRRVA